MRIASLWREFIVALGLALGVVMWFGPVVTFEFLNFDDPDYVTQNPRVQAGLTIEGIWWALRTTHASNWHPLTWLSHMLDCEMYGLWPGGHHLTSLLWHAANAVLVFAMLRHMTHATWPSALVAALFAWHPLRVESVAWVAERKDVLSAFFGLMSVWAYGHFAQAAAAGRRTRSRAAYGLALTCFALGLMSKPMLVTIPCVLLLLDYWPLRRGPFGRDNFDWHSRDVRLGFWRLVGEKIPFLVLALLAGAITLLAQKQGGAIASMTRTPLDARLGNAVVAYAEYLRKTVWPVDLAAFYPHPGQRSWAAVLVAALVLGVLTAGVARARRRYLAVGWLWYLGMLMPVIGLIQVGDQAMADRYTYLPLLGVFIAISWGAKDWLEGRPRWRRAGIVTAVIALATLGFMTRWQVTHWRDSRTLFTRALEVTRNNYIAHNNLGNALDLAGQPELAKAHYRAALQIRPDFAGTHYNLANVLLREGNLDAAAEHYATALALRPDYADAHLNLGIVLTIQKRWDEARAHLHEALRLRPHRAEIHHQLGVLHFRQGNLEAAVAAYQSALALRPDYAEARVNWGIALEHLGQTDEAVAQYQAALATQPNLAHAHANLAILLARQGRTDLALPHFQAVVRLEPANADAHYNLANALVVQGALQQAAAHYREALRLNPNDQRAREKLNALLDRMPEGQP